MNNNHVSVFHNTTEFRLAAKPLFQSFVPLDQRSENKGRFPFNKKFRNEISGIPCDEWNSIFRLFRFSGILGQPREVHPKFRNETPENVCSIRSPTRNIRNFWSNGKRPWLFLFSGILGQAREVHLKFRNDIPENVLSIRSSPGISGIFGRMESAQELSILFPEPTCLLVSAKTRSSGIINFESPRF